MYLISFYRYLFIGIAFLYGINSESLAELNSDGSFLILIEDTQGHSNEGHRSTRQIGGGLGGLGGGLGGLGGGLGGAAGGGAGLANPLGTVTPLVFNILGQTLGMAIIGGFQGLTGRPGFGGFGGQPTNNNGGLFQGFNPFGSLFPGSNNVNPTPTGVMNNAPGTFSAAPGSVNPSNYQSYFSPNGGSQSIPVTENPIPSSFHPTDFHPTTFQQTSNFMPQPAPPPNSGLYGEGNSFPSQSNSVRRPRPYRYSAYSSYPTNLYNPFG